MRAETCSSVVSTLCLFLLTYLPEFLFQDASAHFTSRCSWPFSSLYKILCCPMFIGSLFCRLNNEAVFPCPLTRNLDQMLAHNVSLKLAKARSLLRLLASLLPEPSTKPSEEYFLKEKRSFECFTSCGCSVFDLEQDLPQLHAYLWVTCVIKLNHQEKKGCCGLCWPRSISSVVLHNPGSRKTPQTASAQSRLFWAWKGGWAQETPLGSFCRPQFLSWHW